MWEATGIRTVDGAIASTGAHRKRSSSSAALRGGQDPEAMSTCPGRNRNVLTGVRYESHVLVPSLVGDVDVPVRRLNQRGRDDRASVEVRPPRRSAREIVLALSANGHQVGRVVVVQIPKVPRARRR